MARYQIIRKLATGGMAEVFLGRALGAGGFAKPVAIKRILPHLAADRDFVTRFLDEARLTVHLQHANVVQVFDLGHAGADHVMVLEFVDGDTLRAVLREAQSHAVPLPHHQMAFVIQQVAEGLAYAHEVTGPAGARLNIIHRDINPANVMVSAAGEVKLADFGIARAALAQSQTATGVLRGKIGYFAPEVAKGHHADLKRSDVFLMGLMLYEVLAGRRLFHQDDFVKSLVEVRDFNLRHVESPPGVPQRLWEIVAHALHPDPERRTRSARELSLSLASFLFDNRLRVGPNDIAQLFARVFPHRRTAPDILDARPIEVLELTADISSPPDKSTSSGVVPASLADAPKPKSKARLGELLVQQHVVTPQQLDQALQEQKKKGGQLGDALMSLGFVSDDDLHAALAEQKGQRFMKAALLEQVEVPEVLRAAVPRDVMKRLQAVPLSIDHQQHLQAAMVDPANAKVIDELRGLTGAAKVSAVTIRPAALERFLGRGEGFTDGPTVHRPGPQASTANDVLLMGAAAGDPAALAALRLTGLLRRAAGKLGLSAAETADLEQQAVALSFAGQIGQSGEGQLPSGAVLSELAPWAHDAALVAARASPVTRAQELLAALFAAERRDVSMGAAPEVREAVAAALRDPPLAVAVVGPHGSPVFAAVLKLLRAGHLPLAAQSWPHGGVDAAIIDVARNGQLVEQALEHTSRVLAVVGAERRGESFGKARTITFADLDAAIAEL